MCTMRNGLVPIGLDSRPPEFVLPVKVAEHMLPVIRLLLAGSNPSPDHSTPAKGE